MQTKTHRLDTGTGGSTDMHAHNRQGRHGTKHKEGNMGTGKGDEHRGRHGHNTGNIYKGLTGSHRRYKRNLMQETINKADCKTLTEPVLKIEKVTKTQ